jgi:hypothetical protein
MNIKEILSLAPSDAVQQLTPKHAVPKPWSDLVKEYDPTRHEVNNKAIYPDKVLPDGSLERVTRITLGFQRLAVKRMAELVCGIPIKRNYAPHDKKQEEAAAILEAVYTRNRIDSLNTDRFNALFAGCEILSLWYATEEQNDLYGFTSPLKLRVRTFSPMKGDELYPLFDPFGDLIALSIGTRRKENNKEVRYLDTYTSDRHIAYREGDGGWTIATEETITIGKIPGVYCMRPTPIWEDTSSLVSEMEWSLSRNGNYLRKNSKPIFAVFADEQIYFGDEEDGAKEARAVVQYPKGSTAGYLTWNQAIDSLKFYIAELRQSFFTQLQLPDWSYESMKATPMSGESRKQLFIDCHLKVKDESGRIAEFLDRETNVIKAFLKLIRPDLAEAFDSLECESEITPFSLTEEGDTIRNLVAASGGEALISQREAVRLLGWSSDPEETIRQINQQKQADLFHPEPNL